MNIIPELAQLRFTEQASYCQSHIKGFRNGINVFGRVHQLTNPQVFGRNILPVFPVSQEIRDIQATGFTEIFMQCNCVFPAINSAPLDVAILEATIFRHILLEEFF